MFDRYRRTVAETPELNVVPVMNLFMVLIPFLLVGAVFFHIGVIPTSIPSHNPQESDVPKTPATVLATVYIDVTGLRVTCDSTSLSPEELQGLAESFPDKRGEYDRIGLQQHLTMLKQAYPKSTTATIIPHDKLKYQKLVAILDVTRERDSGKRDRDGEIIYEELFPVTIFSRFVKAEDTEPRE